MWPSLHFAHDLELQSNRSKTPNRRWPSSNDVTITSCYVIHFLTYFNFLELTNKFTNNWNSFSSRIIFQVRLKFLFLFFKIFRSWKTGTIRGGFGLGTSLQYGVMVRPYETFSHYHDSYFMTHQIKWWTIGCYRYLWPHFDGRFSLTTAWFGIGGFSID